MLTKIRKALGLAKPCGCSVDVGGNPKMSRFSSTTRKGGGVISRVDQIQVVEVCDACFGFYKVTYEWTGLKSPHPDWRVWTKYEMIEEENKMGQTVRKEKKIKHPRYARAYKWSSHKYTENMARWDRCDKEADNINYESLGNDELTEIKKESSEWDNIKEEPNI